MHTPSDDLARHARLRRVDEGLASKRVNLHTQLVLHEFACLPTREAVASDDGGRVDLLLDELVRAPKQLGGNEDNGGRAITDFLVLLLRKVDENAARGVLDRKEGKDRRAVVGDGHLLHNGEPEDVI